MKLHEGIKKAIEIRDKSIVLEKTFINILSDFVAFSEHPYARKIVTNLCSSKYLNDLLNLCDNQDSYSKEFIIKEIDRIAYVVSGHYDQDLDLVRYCCESIAYGLGLTQDIVGFYTVDNFKHAKFIGKWFFYFKKDHVQLLNIQRNYKASTNMGYEFEWKPISDTEIEIFIDGIIYYRGEIETDIITGTAYREFHDKQWLWKAIKQSSVLSADTLPYSTWRMSTDIGELNNKEFQFLPHGELISNDLGSGKWFVDNQEVLFTLANGYISCIVQLEGNKLIGKAKNKSGNNWEFQLQRL